MNDKNENDIDELLNYITNHCDDIIDNISDSKTNNNYKGKFAADIEKLEKRLQDLKDEDADKLLSESEEIEKNSNQLLNFTNTIKKNSLDVKKDIIKHLWKILISDNTVDQYESNLMRRICGLIYIPDKICAEIKLQLISNK